MKHISLFNRTLVTCLTSVVLLLVCFTTTAQVKVGDNPNSIKNASLLELESTNKGLVMPRVSLTGAITSPAPLAADILPGTIVYNTNAAFIGGTGLQIWTGSTWMVITPTSLGSTDAWKLTGNSGTDPSTNFIGTTDAQPLIFKVNGQRAGYLNSSGSATSTSFGYQSLNVNTGNDNTAMGYFSMLGNTTGSGNTSFGVSSLRTNTTGSSNTANGWNSLYSNTVGYSNTALGVNSLANNTTGNNNIALGIGSLQSNISGTNNTAIGNLADVSSNNLTNATAIGYKANVAVSNALVLGDSTDNIKVGIGTGSPTANLHVKGSVRFGGLTNGVLTADAAGNLSTTTIAAINGSNWSLTGNSGTDSTLNFLGTTDAQPLILKVNGQKAGKLEFTSASANTSYGYQSLNVNTGNNNTSMGYLALSRNSTGYINTATGATALANNTTGTSNTASGYFSLTNNTAGSFNTANGKGSLYRNTTGISNTGTGYDVLYYNTTGRYNTASGANSLINNITGNFNVAYGDTSLLTNTTGSYNTAIGHYADVTSANLTNATAIGANARVNISNALVLGDSTDNVKVGIGTGSPTANLHVKGAVRFENITNGVLTADALGNLSTTSLASINGSNWSLTGNAGTDSTINFLGTRDAEPLIFKVYNQKAGRVDYSASANTSFGYLSLNNNTGQYNVAIGQQALKNNTTGSFNTANGALSLILNTTGNNNTATGLQAIRNNTIGNDNVANGFNAMLSNTSGSSNVANGSSALTNNTTGNYNTANGALSLAYNTTSSNNTATGYSSLTLNTSGSTNTANGAHALGNNTIGSSNVATGYSVLQSNISGNNNTASGYVALNQNTSGSSNVASGNGAGFSNTTGSFNTAYGSQALYSNITGNNNTALGSGANVTSGNLSNATAIGANANVAISNALVLGDNNINVGIGTSSPLAGLHVANNDVLFASAGDIPMTPSPPPISGAGRRTMWYADKAAFRTGNVGGTNWDGSNIGNYSFAAGNNSQAKGIASVALGYSVYALGDYSSVFGFNSSASGTGNFAAGYNAYAGGIGSFVLGYNSDALVNGGVALGTNNHVTGLYSSAIGYGNSIGASYSTALGISNSTGGNQSMTLGANLTTSSFNEIVLGSYNATRSANAASWVATDPLLVIGNGTPGNSLDAFTILKNGNTGIGASNPTAILDVNGSVRFESLPNGILTTDALGNLSTTTLSAVNGSNWSLTGNSGTNPSTNFIGTTDAKPLVFKVNGQFAGKIDPSNVFFGPLSSSATTGNYNAAFGYKALSANTTADQNSAFGALALQYNTGIYNSAFGSVALGNNTTGINNTAVGLTALNKNVTGSYNTAIGVSADVASNNLSNATAIGYAANVAISNAVVLGDSVNNIKVGIGTGSPTANLHVKGTVRFAGLTNGILTADANGNLRTTSFAANSWSLTGNSGSNPSTNFIGTTDAQPLIFKVNGQNAGRIENSGTNTSFGYLTLNSITTGSYNVASGYLALSSNTTGIDNVGNGVGALTKNTTGNDNTANGYSALALNIKGNDNVANGSVALYSNTSGNDNVANGSFALYSNTTGGNNVADGYYALYSNITGSNNTAIGYGADVSTGNLTNATAIGANTTVSVSNSVVLGNNVTVGIGTSSPNTAYKLHVYSSGGYENTFVDGNNTTGTWLDINNSSAGGSEYNIIATGSGNGEGAGKLLFRNNNGTNNMIFNSRGQVGFGTNNPGTNAKVEIAGSVSASPSNYEYITSTSYGHSAGGTANYSLYTSNRIWCGEEIDVTSDMRTKTNILTSGSLKDLALVNKLRVVNYNYKDKVAKGTSNITGFLAQEVEQVMPDAVTKNTGVVPDIYQNATSAKYDSSAKTLTLSLKEITDIKAGDTVKLITDAGEQLAAVSAANGNNIIVSNWLNNSKWVFVYGRQVHDMRNLDYNKIFSAGIGAIQELSKQNESLKNDVETLKAQMKALMDKMTPAVQANYKPKPLYSSN